MANFKLHYAPIPEKIAAIFEFLTKQKMFKNTGAEHWKISLFMFCKLDYFKLGFGELLTTCACKKGTFGVLHFQIIDIFYGW